MIELLSTCELFSMQLKYLCFTVPLAESSEHLQSVWQGGLGDKLFPLLAVQTATATKGKEIRLSAKSLPNLPIGNVEALSNTTASE